MRVLLVVSGASGLVVGLRLAEALSAAGAELHTVVTPEALLVADYECMGRRGFVEALRRFSKNLYLSAELDAPVASSSHPIDAGAAAPASMRLVASLAQGIHSDLASRALGSLLRSRKRVVLIFREAPLGPVELRNLYRLAEMGAVIVPAVIGLYSGAETLREAVDFVVGKALDALGIENKLYRRWSREAPPRDPCRAFYGQS